MTAPPQQQQDRRQIFAMGGGGFTMEPANPLLDDFVLSLPGTAEPKILFLPTASGDTTAQINAFHTKMLAYYLDKLRSTPDGDGSLLDHSMMLYGGALSDGNLHLYTSLPLLLVAGAASGIKGGQHIRYPNRTPMTNLLLTMLDKANVPRLEKLGDSTGRLDLAASAARAADSNQPVRKAL